MNGLLDTHSFLWFIENDVQLSPFACTLIESADTTPFLSVASLWEIAIKNSIGKLIFHHTFQELVEKQIEGNDIGLLSLQALHLDVLIKLPFHHRDPFDRLLIAQAIAEQLTLLSRDRAFASYPLQVLW